MVRVFSALNDVTVTRWSIHEETRSTTGKIQNSPGPRRPVKRPRRSITPFSHWSATLRAKSTHSPSRFTAVTTNPRVSEGTPLVPNPMPTRAETTIRMTQAAQATPGIRTCTTLRCSGLSCSRLACLLLFAAMTGIIGISLS